MHKVDQTKGLECSVDAPFSGGWNPSDPFNPTSVLLRTRSFVSCLVLPIYWISKIQKETALWTYETEYIPLSTAMREVILVIKLLNHLKVACDAIATLPKVTHKGLRTTKSAWQLKNPKIHNQGPNMLRLSISVSQLSRRWHYQNRLHPL